MNREDAHWWNQRKVHEPLVYQEHQSIHNWWMDDWEVVFYRISSHPYVQIVIQESRSRDQQNQESSDQPQMELSESVFRAESDDIEHILKDV